MSIIKNIKRAIITLLLFSILFLIYCFIPTRITPKQKLSQDDIKIKANLQVTTGPLYYLEEEDEAKLWNTIKDIYPNANPQYLELTGNYPNFAVNDPVTLGDIIVYGKVIGTYEDSTEGTIPLFYVSYSDAKLAPIFRDDTIIGNFPVRIILILIVFLLIILSPIFLLGFLISLIIVLLKKRKNLKKS